MLLALFDVIQTRCQDSNVLGTWKIYYSDLNQQDIAECTSKPKTHHTLVVTLKSPNIAVTDDGFMGSWVLSGTEAIQISVQKLDFYFIFASEADGPNYTISHCNVSSRGWVSEQGIGRPQGCIYARNVQADGEPSVRFANHGIDPSVKMNRGPILKTDRVPYQGDILPASFDWRNVSGYSFVQPPLDYFACDSSYLFATLFMMSSRVRIQSNNSVKPLFSLYEQLDCNVYANKCEGGLPEQVGLYAEKIGIVDEDTYYVEYKGVPGQCKRFDSAKRYYFYQTALLGNQPHPYSALEMQWEIYRYGPIVAGISMQSNFPAPFGDYSGRIDHYLLLVGWTVLKNGTPVWIAQNSWGHHWNSDGAAYIARGVNSYGIETAAYVTNWRSEGAPQWAESYKPVVTHSVDHKDPTALIMAVLLVIASVLAVVLAIFLIVQIVRGKFAKKEVVMDQKESE